MAHTARAEADCKEYIDDPETLNKKIKKLAQLVHESKHFVVFTGAGISTAAGIADFRSGINTILDTGAGAWAKSAAVKQGISSKQIKKNKKKTNSFKAIPTKSHMALVALMTQKPNYLKYLISQNTDGLHRRSGITINQMSELHGNSTLEVCHKCNKEYMRDYRCRNSFRKQSSHDHKTGRYCTIPNCRGKLHDTIINFKESLPDKPFKKANDNSNICDLMLCLGSSLTVTPAANMPQCVGDKWKEEMFDHALNQMDNDNNDNDIGSGNINKAQYIKKLQTSIDNGQIKLDVSHNLVIVNLQKTKLDSVCSLRIFAKIDDVMVGLMKELKIEIPIWNLQKFVKVKLDKKKLTVSGVDVDGINATVFTDVKCCNNGEKLEIIKEKIKKEKLRPDEYVFNVDKKLEFKEENDEKKNENENENDINKNKGLVVELTFYGNYNEPKLLIVLNDYLSDLIENNINGEIVLRLVYDINTKKWIVKGKEYQMKDKDIGKLWVVGNGNNTNNDSLTQ